MVAAFRRGREQVVRSVGGGRNKKCIALAAAFSLIASVAYAQSPRRRSSTARPRTASPRNASATRSAPDRKSPKRLDARDRAAPFRRRRRSVCVERVGRRRSTYVVEFSCL